jgi:hypothetical protein
MNWPFLSFATNVLNFFQLRSINSKLDAMQPLFMPEVDCRPVQYLAGEIQGPPPERPRTDEEVCTRFSDYEEFRRQEVILEMERRFCA